MLSKLVFFMFRILLHCLHVALLLKQYVMKWFGVITDRCTDGNTSTECCRVRVRNSIKHVAIIGAGPAGIAGIKSLLELGSCFDRIVCFEKHSDVGGIWDVDRNDTAMYKYLHTNTSKQMMPYTDEIMPHEYPDYPSQAEVLQYLRDYSKKYDLKKYIKFNTQVVKVEPINDVQKSNGNQESLPKWKVTYRSHCKDTGNIENNDYEMFDAVIVANGHYESPHLLPIHQEIKSTYKRGKLIHSHDYKDNEIFKDKSVLVVGMGSSGADIASLIQPHCRQIYISIKDNAVVFPKYTWGIPGDQLLRRRFITTILPSRVKKKISSFLQFSQTPSFTHLNIRLNSNRSAANTNAGISTDLLHRVGDGSIKVFGKINSCTESEIIFDDGKRISPDYIIVCTGYHYKFPFLDDNVIQYSGERVNDLYHHIFHTKHPTLSFLGIPSRIEPLPYCELQSQWIALFLSGKQSLPSSKEMKKWEQDREEMFKMQKISPKFWHRVDYATDMDLMAKIIGCYPNFMKWEYSDLFWELVVMPQTPCHYRLCGPFSKYEEARNNILQKSWMPPG